MLAIWYALFGQNDDFGVFSLAYLTIGSLEFAVGLWNRFAPSAEGVFFDGVVLLLFGSATLMRQYLMWQGQMAGRPSTFSLLFGAYWVWQGISHIRAYGGLRRAFAHGRRRSTSAGSTGCCRRSNTPTPRPTTTFSTCRRRRGRRSNCSAIPRSWSFPGPARP